MLVLAVLGVDVLVVLGIGLALSGGFGLAFVASTDWDPVQEVFGGGVPIYGTLLTALLAILMAVPAAFGIAFFLTELAPDWMRRPVGVAVGPDRRSLLVADDVGNVVWRLSGK